MADKRVEYTIGVKNEGLENLTRIIDELDKAGVETSEFKKQAELLRQQLAETAQQQSLIDSFVKIKQEVGAAGTAMETAQAKAQQLGRELAATDAPTKKQTAEFGRAREAVNGTKDAYQAAQQRLQAMRGTLADNNIETTGLAQKQALLRNGVREVDASVAGATTRLKELGSTGPKAANDTAAATDRAATSTKGYQGALTQVAGAVAGAFAVSKVVDYAKSVQEVADQYKNLEARLRLAVGAQGDLQAAVQGVGDVAKATHTSLDATSVLYARLAMSAKELKITNDEALGITKAINQAIQVSGASAQSSEAAVRQLVQGLQSGVLRGDEFNSVMENSPRLAKALADGLNVPIGALRGLAEAGELTSAKVVRALKGQSEAIDKEFSTLPLTVGRALANLETQWTLFVGSLTGGAAQSSMAAQGINALAENLDTLAAVAGRAGAVLTAALAVQGVQALRAFALEMAVTGKAANLMTLELSKVPKVISITVAAVGFEVGYQIGEMLHENSELARKLGVGMVGFMQALVNDLIFLKEAAAAVFTSDTVDAAFDRYIARGKEMDQILESMWKDAENAPSKISGAADAGAGSLDKLGGAGAAAGQAVAAGGAAGAAGVGQVAKAAEDARSALAGMATAINAKPAAPNGIEDIVRDLTAAKLRGEDLDLLLRQKMPDAISKLSGPELAKFRADFIRAMDEAGIKGKAVETGLRLIGEQAAKSLGVDLVAASNKTSKAFEDARANLSLLIRSMPELKAAGVDAAAVVAQAMAKMINGAKSQAEIDAVIRQVNALRKQLGDKVADGLLDQAALKAGELKKALEDATPGIQSVGEAMRKLGVVSEESLKNTAKESKEAYDFMVEKGTSSAREMSAAFQKTAADAIAANKGIAPSWVNAQAATRGFAVEVDAAGKAILKATGEGGKAFSEMGQHIRAATEDMKAQGVALDAINAKYGQSAKDKANKYGRPGDDAAAQADERTKRLSGQNAVDNTLMFKLRDKGANLTAADIPELEAVLAAERKNDKMINNRLGGRAGLYSLDGLRDDSNWRQIKAQWQSFIDGEKNKVPSKAVPSKAQAAPANAPVRAPAPQPTQQQVSQPSQSGGSSSSMATHTVNINLNGAVSTVSTDANGAAALKGMLSQLAAARGSAAR